MSLRREKPDRDAKVIRDQRFHLRNAIGNPRYYYRESHEFGPAFIDVIAVNDGATGTVPIAMENALYRAGELDETPPDFVQIFA
jgi:hypothetical protein